MRFKPSRRDLLVLSGGIVCSAISQRTKAQTKPKVAALFAGRIDDSGFMEAGYRGLMAARDKLGVEVVWQDQIKPERDLLAAALRDLAKTGAAMVIAHGGQNNEAAKLVAAEFPQTRFVVTQGNVTTTNLASYEVLQEESAFLAGALAAWMTKTGVVGHMSGIRVVPGLKGRAAYANGVAYANPAVRLLTNFSGHQDDNALSKRVASAMIAAKADIIFTMLNAGRAGAIDACREGGAKQIGNVRDWAAAIPDVFVASAVADSGIALLRAVEDLVSGAAKTNAIEKIGLNRPDAVRLTMAAAVDDDLRRKIEALATDIQSGKVDVSTTWSGEEFPNPA
ncbi:BMP family protein [Pseudorhodoplanes sinuspersici]|uniref:BMP family ABC transporter substrate-binding protein n=1 Tax=Pseudorhodoplanes sinuspersici TaxID=1235591 RepID=A0A1W6ZNN3_9HYPH|nr:BMP family protein [Pseudorhodoplanes sinuspersici]ARP98394.1 BMP family ABC transporter substrate-binding protein [Pseudorhodoplanes sinuspersici]RKE66059.1 nucleoside-binding protein [Pseudorhodoplanes sinuspersici]